MTARFRQWRSLMGGLGLIGLSVCDPSDSPSMLRDAGAGSGDLVTTGGELPSRIPVLRVTLGGRAIEREVDVVGTLEVFEAHAGRLEDLDRHTPTLQERVAIQGRGTSSWAFPKKSYSVEVQDDAGADKDVAILGMPPGSDFALYACYSDKTCLRNAIMYGLGQSLGRWSPRARYVELIVDGDYRGLYMLLERIRRDRTRVAIPKPAKTAEQGDITGGYIIRLEGTGKDRRESSNPPRDFRARGRRKYTFHYPDAKSVSPEQAAYLSEYMASFERAMAKSPEQYEARIDVTSWVERFIVEEFSLNRDAYVRSVYMTKQRDADGGKLAMGPLWDYDLTFGNTTHGQGCRTDVWAHENAAKIAGWLPEYWSALLAQPSFLNAIKCRYAELRAGPLSREVLDARITAWAAFTREARVRDKRRWNTTEHPGLSVCFSTRTDEAAIEALRGFIDARLTWLDAQITAMPGECD